jgi:dTDP-4-amino-4,6-dideoxygalactose transaminase
MKSEYYDVWELTINNSFTGGLFNNKIDNENYIRIIKNYDIDDNRITKEEIDMEPKTHYNPWPIGKVPKELQRPELDKLKELGYNWSDPRDVIDMFETKVAKFAGSKYAVSIDCCSNGLFLSLKYLQSINEVLKGATLEIPKMTYISVPMQIIHAGNQVTFKDLEWSGVYQLKGSRVWDGAVRWTKNMYVGNNALQVVSFQIKKRIPIGKGGIILTDDYEAYKWLKLASYDGRDLNTPYTDVDHVKMLGYHMYMTPEDAARGIILIDSVPEVNEDTGNHTTYVDASEIIHKIF